MWYCHRGDDYQIGHSTSKDGTKWKNDLSFSFPKSGENWDNLGTAYPSVFKHNNIYFLIYAGNRFGKDGIGYAIGESIF